MTYPRTNRSNLVLTAGRPIVAATLSVDNAGSGATVALQEPGYVKINHLWRCINCRASYKLSCEGDQNILGEHF